MDQPPRPQLGEAASDADSRLERGVGEYPGSVEVEQDRCMAQPGGGEPVVGPIGGIGALRSGSGQAAKSVSSFTTEARGYAATFVDEISYSTWSSRASGGSPGWERWGRAAAGLAASVTIDGQIAGAIGRGFCLLVGFTHSDTTPQVDWMADKVAGLRLFSDAEGKMNLGLRRWVAACWSSPSSRSTATRRRAGDPRSSTPPGPKRPSRCTSISSPRFGARARGRRRRFGADMLVEIHNDGPVTLILERNA